MITPKEKSASSTDRETFKGAIFLYKIIKLELLSSKTVFRH